MGCVIYDHLGTAQWAGTRYQVYSEVKHHMGDGKYLVTIPNEYKVELFCREDGIVYPLATKPLLDGDTDLELLAEEGKRRLDELLTFAKERLHDVVEEQERKHVNAPETSIRTGREDSD